MYADMNGQIHQTNYIQKDMNPAGNTIMEWKPKVVRQKNIDSPFYFPNALKSTVRMQCKM